MAIGNRTESSLRFEKGLPRQLVRIAAARAIELLQDHAQARVVGAIKVGSTSAVISSFPVSTAQIKRLTGIEIPSHIVRELLSRLGCTVDMEGEHYIITPPWWRQDLQIPEDVIEEIVRLYGLDKIPSQPLTGVLSAPTHQAELPLIWQLRDRLARLGFTETYNYSFYGQQLLDRAGIGVTSDHIEILNPLSEDLRYLRVSLLPRLLETVERNLPRQQQLQLFEVGHVYFADREVQQLMLVQTGTSDPYRQLRGAVEQLLADNGIRPTTRVITASVDCPYWEWYASKQALEWVVNDTIIGTIGLLSTSIAGQFHIDQDLAVATLSIPSLLALPRPSTTYSPISDYPAVELDWSLLIPDGTSWQMLADVMKQHDANHWIQSLEVVDLYRGQTVPAGHYSLTVHVVLQATGETLAMTDVEQWRDQLMAELKQQFQASLRDR